MLRELHISNLAVIADAKIEFAPQLNCFTGATGAGKSLIIGALEVLLGLRNPSEMLRPGTDEGRVNGIFDVRNKEVLAQIEKASDVNVTTDGGEILLTRKLYASGRSSVSLNGQPITLGMLKQISEFLVDVHGQHDHQYLLRPSNQIDVIDQFGELWDLRKKYYAVFEQLQSARKRLEELSTNQSLRKQQLELYRFQAQEIDAAELDGAEYAELQARASVLVNLEKLKKDTGAVQSALYEIDGSVLERLKMMAAVLAELSELDPQLKEIAGNVKESTISLEESAFDLSRYLDKLDLDPSELVEVNERLNTINRMLNKYGDPIDATIAYRKEIGGKIDELERAGDDLTTLRRQLDPLQKELKQLGDDLTATRKAVAKKLSSLIEKQLAELGMEKAKFTVEVTPASVTDDQLPATPSGFDQVEFIAQTNPGQTPQPLRKIASGGEMSRIMLALKSILAQSDRVSVLVFDEIDANVGGRLGSTIGSKLRKLAEHHQVLCITHLPQIASYADRHFTVSKHVTGGKTDSKVRVMEGEERLEELAEMIGGSKITDTTRAQAREMLENAGAEIAPVAKSKATKKVAGQLGSVGSAR
jgi:DNA repair protein RecN (Recombination protein N)